MNDNSFKPVTQPKGKKPMAKFNTSEFGQYDLNKKDNNKVDIIYEEEEQKAWNINIYPKCIETKTIIQN